MAFADGWVNGRKFGVSNRSKKRSNSIKKAERLGAPSGRKLDVLHGSEENQGEEEETQETGGPPQPVTTCELCCKTPCLLQQGLYDSLCEYYGECLESDHMDNLISNKEVRFGLYRQATITIHGHLGRGRRCPLPQCVVTEIRDLAMESDGNYVGFKKGERDSDD